jgi:uncharacterized membrane protein YhaH (DUF805 family)
MVEHLYVRPDLRRRGIGSALLQRAKERLPSGFRLWVFQQNVSARRFCERHGLRLVEETDGSRIRVGGGALSFSEAIKTCFQKYAEFRGRASRPEFWWFALLYYLVILVPIVPLIAVGSVGRGDQPWDKADMNVAGVIFGIVIGVAVLALLIPYLAVGTRRLHDTGKPGWWWFITLVPFGSIILIVFWAIEGDKGSNQYGPPPGARSVQPAPPGSLPPPPTFTAVGLGAPSSWLGQ